MNRAQFVENVAANAARVKKYRLGGDGSDGSCDCIGLIIGAIRLAGEKWTGVHGSNYAARYVLRTLEKASKTDLAPGDVVFKCREKGCAGYALPGSYADHADQRDYYHVGVVMAVHPLEILHCTGVEGGIKRDGTLGAWSYRGVLKQVTEDTVARVVTGGKLALRRAPDKSAPLVCRLPNGAQVEELDQAGGWSRVRCGEQEGYSMTEFLVPCQEPLSLSLPREAAQMLYQVLKNALE